MRNIKWEVSEHDIAIYAKEVLEIELTDWQLLHIMDNIEVQLDKVITKAIDETMSLDE